MSHVKKGCLSDPPSNVVKIHRFNQKTKKTYTARSTGTNEVDARELNHLLDQPSIGLTKADRVVGDCCESSNDRKRVRRLGEQEAASSRTETIQALHGMAYQCGFNNDEIGMHAPECPQSLHAFEEHIGFEHRLPKEFDDSIVEEAVDDEDNLDVLLELDVFLRDVPFDDPGDGICLDRTQFGEVDDNAAPVPSPFDDDDFEPNKLFAFDDDVDISAFLPSILKAETTHETHCRLTKNAPWIPFKHPKHASTFTDLDKAEHKLFMEMSPSYDRNLKQLDAPKGHKTFAAAWEQHVANLYKRSVESEVGGTILNRKSYTQLQDHYDIIKKQQELLALASKEDAGNKNIERVFKETRTEMRLMPQQDAHNCGPVQHPQVGRPTFGVPFALNTNAAARAFEVNQGAGPPMLFRKQQSTKAFQVNRGALGAQFRAKKHCWKCGFQKTLHLRAGLAFGDECNNNCHREECSKCFERIGDCHTDGLVGPFCNKEPHSNSKHNDWFSESTRTTGIT